jgi:hypothetical protein
MGGDAMGLISGMGAAGVTSFVVTAERDPSQPHDVQRPEVNTWAHGEYP